MSAIYLLAYADTTDNSSSNIYLLFGGALIIGAIALAAFVPIALAGRRRHGSHGTIMTLMVFWGTVLAFDAIDVLMEQLRWASEKGLRLQSGYYSGTQARADAPALPWLLWAILAGAYGAILVWSMSTPKPRPVEPLK
jgi:hypothetical protein